MSKRYDIMAPRKGRDDKTFWTRLGTAWQNDNGGIQLVFDALPIPDSEGRCVANLFEPRDDRQRSAQGDRQQAQQRSRGSFADDLDDSLPPF